MEKEEVGAPTPNHNIHNNSSVDHITLKCFGSEVVI